MTKISTATTAAATLAPPPPPPLPPHQTATSSSATTGSSAASTATTTSDAKQQQQQRVFNFDFTAVESTATGTGALVSSNDQINQVDLVNGECGVVNLPADRVEPS